MPILIAFIVIPLIELAVFATVGDRIGLLNTLLLCLVTAMLGGGLLKKQGQETWLAVHRSMQQGGFPAKELFDGFCLIVAGAFLITPGFVTDVTGFLLFVPHFRSFLRHQTSHFVSTNIGPDQTRPTQKHSGDIDGEYSRVDDNDKIK